MKNYKLFLIGILVMAALLQLASFLIKPSSTAKDSGSKNSPSQYVSVRIGETSIKAELASTKEQINAGLSNREKLEENSGMYFVLGGRGNYSFWMKGMRFPLDIVWIDSGKIVWIDRGAQVPTDENIPTYQAPAPVTNVLEVAAGVAQGWEVGAEVIVSD